MTNGSRKRQTDSDAPRSYNVTIVPQRLVFSLAAIAVVLVVCHVGLTIFHYQVEESWATTLRRGRREQPSHLVFRIPVVNSCDVFLVLRAAEESGS